jgi:O-antigen ligase
MHAPTFSRRADACARGFAIALGFSIPISVALDNILLGLLLAAWLASGDFREKLTAIAENPVALAALVLFGLLTLGLAYGVRDPGDGLRYWGKYIDLLFVPVFIGVFRDRRTQIDALKAMGGALLASLVVSWLAHWGLLFQNPLVPPNNAAFPVGFKYSITHSVLISLGAFACAVLARQTASRRLRIVFIGLALIAAHNVLFVVYSRTGYLILAALMLYFFVVQFRWRGLAAAAVLGAALFGAGYYGSPMFEQRVDSAVAEMQEWRPEQPSTTSVGMRMEFYRSSLAIVREHLLFGAGTGSFPAAYAATVGSSKMEKTVNPHNEYLLIAIQTGLVGLASLLYLFYTQWRLAVRLEPPFRNLARGLVLVFVIGCLFNSLLLDHTEGLFFAWATGLLFARLPQSIAMDGRAA